MDILCLHTKREIERYLRRNLALHIYELGDLDEFFWPHTLWFGHHDGRELDAVALVYVGMQTPTLVELSDTVGPGSPPAQLLSSLVPLLPHRFYAHLSPGLADLLSTSHTLAPGGLHHKMRLDTNRLPSEAHAAGSPLPGTIVTLGRTDTDELLEFYAAAYPDNWFDPRMLETDRYVGIRADEDRRLLSVAGVHVYSPEYGVAALGNIATLRSHRGRGLGTTLTAHLCRELVRDGLAVGLNVKADNAAAIATYRKLGFSVVADYEEYAAQRVVTGPVLE